MKAFKIVLLVIIFNSCKAQNRQTMDHELLSEYIAPSTNAKIAVLFGGNPHRRDEIVRLLMTLESVTIYATLSEEEGMKKITDLPKVDLVLIGGRYSEEQRIRIRAFVKTNLPNTQVTEPGYGYPYDNGEMLKDVRTRLQLKD